VEGEDKLLEGWHATTSPLFYAATKQKKKRMMKKKKLFDTLFHFVVMCFRYKL
jgi:hypothetical protein